MQVLIAGASGMIGIRLQQYLNEQGHDVRTLIRKNRPHERQWMWNPDTGYVPSAALHWAQAVINLGGAPLARIPWTTNYKKTLALSRLNGTRTLARAIAASPNPPRVWINASAVGFYGDRPGEQLTETSAPGQGFLAELTRRWEQATDLDELGGLGRQIGASGGAERTRVACIRTGIVLDRGGALAPLALATRMGLGAQVGSGQQFWPWIALDDHVRAIAHVLHEESLSGPVNLVSQASDTVNDVTKALARVLHRPHLLQLPAWLLRAVIGEVADEMLLASQDVRPEKLVESGFSFHITDVQQALEKIFR